VGLWLSAFTRSNAASAEEEVERGLDEELGGTLARRAVSSSKHPGPFVRERGRWTNTFRTPWASGLEGSFRNTYPVRHETYR
jgi:hypothetical protein